MGCAYAHICNVFTLKEGVRVIVFLFNHSTRRHLRLIHIVIINFGRFCNPKKNSGKINLCVKCRSSYLKGTINKFIDPN